MLDPEKVIYHYVLLVFLSAGITIAILRRILRSDIPEDLGRYNVIPLVLIATIAITGYVTGFLIPDLQKIQIRQ